MDINTDLFGKIQIDENAIIEFESGLPGFQDEKRFTLIKDREHFTGVFSCLQSVENPSLAFTLLDTFSVLPDYNPLVDESDISDIGEYVKDDLQVYNVLFIAESVTDITVNLKAPIIINVKSKKGKQVIVDNAEYTIKYRIFEQLKNRK